MKKQTSPTVKGAWIGFWGLIIAAVIYGIFMIIGKSGDDITLKTDGDQSPAIVSEGDVSIDLPK